ncbi:MAG: hypothetical protein COB67_01225 [SAR324 cluster bacterium]|uniref:Uncharacterized protein n=1 Tax=SAR324 cluster bacterium TaxID=2024889 RepID=A0A2A4TAF7_9DELT|nr:MAG: hypothetical protein COB67_01225 [SAR324 cluster bacterium]
MKHYRLFSLRQSQHGRNIKKRVQGDFQAFLDQALTDNEQLTPTPKPMGSLPHRNSKLSVLADLSV